MLRKCSFDLFSRTGLLSPAAPRAALSALVKDNIEKGISIEKDHEEATETVKQTQGGQKNPERIASAISQAREEMSQPLMEETKGHYGEAVVGGGASIVPNAAAHIDATRGPEGVGERERLSDKPLEEVAREAAGILTKRREDSEGAEGREGKGGKGVSEGREKEPEPWGS